MWMKFSNCRLPKEEEEFPRSTHNMDQIYVFARRSYLQKEMPVRFGHFSETAVDIGISVEVLH